MRKALRNISHRQEEKEECVNAKFEYFMKMLFFVCVIKLLLRKACFCEIKARVLCS